MSEQEIVSFLKENGPSTPAQLAKRINTSLLFASAMLGEVSSKGVVKISNLKIGGGSPLYYLKEHGDQLVNFADKLGLKEKDAYTLIKEKQVVRDREQTPIIRVTLRAIKDFAVPINIVRGEDKELFWKWYLLNDKETEEKIKKIIGTTEKKEIKREMPVEKKEIETPIQKVEEVSIKKVGPNPERKEIKERIVEKRAEPVTTNLTEFGVTDLNVEFSNICKNAFGRKITVYFDEKSIKIERYEQIKKNKEFWFVLRVPSTIGSSKFFCKVIDKKKISEGDLSYTLVEGQHKQLPVLFMTTGSLNKKTEEVMNTLFKDINFIKI